MHGPINVKSPNNTSKWQMGFNSAFKGLKTRLINYPVTNCRKSNMKNVKREKNIIRKDVVTKW
jgi:hypothetical protein